MARHTFPAKALLAPNLKPPVSPPPTVKTNLPSAKTDCFQGRPGPCPPPTQTLPPEANVGMSNGTAGLEVPWAPLVAQTVKTLPAMPKSCV